MSVPAERSTPATSTTGAPPAAPQAIDERLRLAQIELLYQQATPTLIGAGAALLFFVYVLYGSAPPQLLWSWLGVSGLVYVLRFTLVRIHRNHVVRTADRHPWDLWYLLGALLSGLLWGVAGLLLLPENSIAHQAFLVVGVTGLGAGAAVSYAALPGLPQAFIVPALAPFGLHLIASGDKLQQMMGFVVLMFMAVLAVSAMVMQRSIERSLRLGLEKEALAQTLSQSKDEADALNRELREEIDERRRAEQRIRSSRRELSRILENMQDLYFRVDLHGKVITASPSVLDLLGYTADEVVGLTIADVFVEHADLERFMLLLERSGGAIRGFEARMRRKDGTEVWVSKNAQYFRDDAGAIAGIEGTSHDITRLKAAQAELNAEKERALVTLAAIADGVIAT
ncbi:MAG: PAS domain S-box protein, partial [Thiohalobacteraceae bacterium]